MTEPLRQLGNLYTKAGFPEIGHSLKDLAALGEKAGMPKELPNTEVIFERRNHANRPLNLDERGALIAGLVEDLEGRGVSQKVAYAVSRAVSSDLPTEEFPDNPRPLGTVRKASDLSNLSDEELLDGQGIGEKTVEAIRTYFPYHPPQEDFPTQTK